MTAEDPCSQKDNSHYTIGGRHVAYVSKNFTPHLDSYGYNMHVLFQQGKFTVSETLTESFLNRVFSIRTATSEDLFSIAKAINKDQAQFDQDIDNRITNMVRIRVIESICCPK